MTYRSDSDQRRLLRVRAWEALRQAEFHWLGVLLLPWLLLLMNPAWIYTPSSMVDPWVYFGYFNNLRQHLSEFFPGLYYGTRLPWILPGWLAYSLLPLHAANLVLHVTFYYVSTFSLYVTFKHIEGPRAALLATVLLGTHTFFLRANAWDYVDGAGIAYYLATIAFLTQAVRTSRPVWVGWAGVTAACMVYTNLFLLIFGPTFLLYYGLLGFPPDRVRATSWCLRSIAWFAGGIMAITVFLSVVNYLLGGEFWFFMPSVRFALSNLGKPNPWKSANYEWLKLATPLGFPAIGFVASVTQIVRTLVSRADRDRFVLFFASNYAATVLLMTALDVSGMAVLQYDFYSSYLIAPLFLAIGSIFFHDAGGLRGSQFLTIVGIVAVAFAWPVTEVHRTFLGYLLVAGWLSVLWPSSLAIGAFGAVVRVVGGARGRFPATFMCCLALLQLLLVSDRVGLSASSWQEQPAVYQRVQKAMELIMSVSGDRKPWFWYDAKEPQRVEFLSIAATYLWEWSLISDQLPRVRRGIELQSGELVVVLSEDHDLWKRTRGALAGFSLQPRLLRQEPAGGGRVRYWITFMETELAIPGQRHALSLGVGGRLRMEPEVAEAMPLPASGWTAVEQQPRTAMDVRPDGIYVTTTTSRWGYATRYVPVSAPVDGTYRFILRYRQLSGGMSFGALSAEEDKWLVRAGAPSRDGDRRIKELTLKLKAGDRLVLMTTNAYPWADERSSYVIEDLRAFCYLQEH